MRLFVALDVPPGVRAALASWAHETVGEDERLRLIAVESLHATLVFLGERPDAEAPQLSEAVMGAVGEAAPPLVVDGPLWLSPRRPHVLAARLADPSGGLARTHAALLEALGREPEPRPLLPHVTVARVRGRVRPFKVPAPPAIEFAGTAVTLYRSILNPAHAGPARYEPLASVSLSTLP
ncbi:MAG: 2,3-cyclic 3-phosphodiesterase [Solirubrobacteraceae bacterium]|nr:2,3-cyclic 3-phosphodiesterase [Solirubrobacteraceae bacterium]